MTEELPTISPEDNWRQVWHTNCPKWMEGYPKRNPTSGIARRLPDFHEIEDGSVLRKFECTHCGVVFYAGLDAKRFVVVRSEASVRADRWIAGFKEVARTLAKASERDRKNAVDVLVAMGASEEEMREGEITLREMLSPPRGVLIPLVPHDGE